LVVVLLIAAGVALLPGMRRETTLEFQVRDTVSGAWVWDMEARIQDRVINGFFQSDQGLKTYRFTGLEPGSATLAISAPSYIPVEIPVELGRGENTFASPISLLGYEIPGLSNFLAFERAHTTGWEISLRPVSAENRAILFHPTLDIWVGVRITSWDSGLAPTVENLDARPTLYEGPLRWRWDSTPETQFRYLVDLPFSLLSPFDGPSISIEYLILVPDPRIGAGVDLGAIAVQLFDLDREQINAFLDTPTEGFTAYTDVSWNVRR
jgi:hypothetical protein